MRKAGKMDGTLKIIDRIGLQQNKVDDQYERSNGSFNGGSVVIGLEKGAYNTVDIQVIIRQWQSIILLVGAQHTRYHGSAWLLYDKSMETNISHHSDTTMPFVYADHANDSPLSW